MVSGLEDFIATASGNEFTLLERHRAFGELVNHFQGDGYRYAYSILRNVQLAQDVTQESFLIAYQRLYQLREPQAFPLWFRQIIRSQCNRATRKHTLQTVPLDRATDLHSSGDDPAIQAEEIDLHGQVMAALEGLPAHEQTVIRLFYLKEFSIQEIADALALPITTVKKRLQYAREHMRESLCHFGAVIVELLWVQAQPCFVYQRTQVDRR
jgi:RNA polymerase sigma factor (sigma-70 family)